ncbi:MAG: hypothetical protein ABI706_02110 [Ilumatobacteraceae bacterium]
MHPVWRGLAVTASLVICAQCRSAARSQDSLDHGTLATIAVVPSTTSVGTTIAPVTGPSPVTTVDTGNTIEWSAPADAFVIGALPRGFVPHGQTTEVEASDSPTGAAHVSQTFIDLAIPAQLVVSVDTGPPAVLQLTSSGMTPRTDVLGGTDTYVWIDPDTGQLGTAWRLADESVVWLYGTNISDDTMFEIARSIHITAT